MKDEAIKIAYEAPEVIVHGSFEEITAGGREGGFTDADFPAHTPFSSITFS